MSKNDKTIPEPFPPAKAPNATGPVPQQVEKPSQTATAQGQAPANPQQAAQQKPLPFAMTQAGDYFHTKAFDADIKRYAGYASNLTGYSNLDKIQPLYPGLYALGAISSLGKTTFAHQLADQMAAQGQMVIYFSLEQNRFEIFSKSIARSFFKTQLSILQSGKPSTYPTPSSIDIRRGKVSKDNPAELAQEIDRYTSTVKNHILVVDGAFNVTIEDIIGLVDATVKTGVKPVVIVDYLQIVAPTLINQRIPDTKTAIDHVVHSMKVMQSKYDIPVIAISSLNRANYLVPVDFESFKESGGIEYTADVVWGLQLSVLHSPDYQKEKAITKQREMIAKAKKESPRKIELCCLKNRYGVASYSVLFDYYPANDFFMPTDKP